MNFIYIKNGYTDRLHRDQYYVKDPFYGEYIGFDCITRFSAQNGIVTGVNEFKWAVDAMETEIEELIKDPENPYSRRTFKKIHKWEKSQGYIPVELFLRIWRKEYADDEEGKELAAADAELLLQLCNENGAGNDKDAPKVKVKESPVQEIYEEESIIVSGRPIDKNGDVFYSGSAAVLKLNMKGKIPEHLPPEEVVYGHPLDSADRPDFFRIIAIWAKKE